MPQSSDPIQPGEHLRKEWPRLLADEKELQQRLKDLRQSQREILLEIARLDYGIQPGAVVLSRGAPYRVEAIKASTMLPFGGSVPTPIRRPWVTAFPLNKDGSWSKAVRRLYGNWTLVHSEPPEDFDPLAFRRSLSD